MNAGAYGSEIKNILKSARVMTNEGEVLELSVDELELGYRTSCIPHRGYTVLEASFQLEPGDQEAIEARMKELAARRREKQPLEYPSAGSTFKRPQGYFAGKLIEDAGLRDTHGRCQGIGEALRFCDQRRKRYCVRCNGPVRPYQKDGDGTIRCGA